MQKFAIVQVFALLLGSIHGFAAEAGSTLSNSPNSTPSPVIPALVEVDGVKLTLADYGQKHPGGLFQAYQTFYQSERKAVEDYVDEYLIDRQAQREGVTVAELMNRHVNSAAGKEPSEEALRIYWEGAETTEPFEAVRQQIIDHIRDYRIMRAKADFIKKLRSEAKIAYQFGPPRAPVSLKDAPIRGAADAPIVLVEFADYQCPYCQQAHPVLDQLAEEFKGRMSIAYKDMPLPMHAQASKAAEAAHCAGAQGKYWEYHDVLFKSKALDIPDLKAHARELSLDTAAFDKCLDSGAEAPAVKAQFDEAVGLGLQGTPSFLINGHLFSGGFSIEQMRAFIGQELAISAAQTAKR